MRNGDEASTSIILASWALLAKLLKLLDHLVYFDKFGMPPYYYLD